MSNVRRKKTSPIMWVVIFLCIAMLGVAVSAALTQGFTNADPYGWLDKAKQGIESLNKEEKFVAEEGFCFVCRGVLISPNRVGVGFRLGAEHHLSADRELAEIHVAALVGVAGHSHRAVGVGFRELAALARKAAAFRV